MREVAADERLSSAVFVVVFVLVLISVSSFVAVGRCEVGAIFSCG